MSIHPKRILWPTDFSVLAVKGAHYAEAFRESFRAELHVVHVCPVLTWAVSSVPLMTGGDMRVSVEDLATPARAQLKELIPQLFTRPHQVTTKVLTGTAWYEICRYARDERIDLIVIATHGLTGLRHLMMGSTAERVVQHAAAPVLTVKSIEREFIDQAIETQATVLNSQANSAQYRGKAYRKSGRAPDAATLPR